MGSTLTEYFLSLASVHTLKHGFVIVGSIQYFAKTAFATTVYTTGMVVFVPIATDPHV